MMQATAEILGKKVLVEWSVAADKAMGALSSPLLVEMELYFSCLIRKVVRFNRNPSLQYSVSVTPRLTVGFRPVVTKACSVSEVEDEPPLEDFQAVRPEAFVPKKLFIDFKRGQWVGEFHMSRES
ncbi:MAG TPA: hypothetical protein VMV48_03590 [Gallionellaceae bacterium]|nr:hypothetical protein [Gallionellaceae bacterium]